MVSLDVFEFIFSPQAAGPANLLPQMFPVFFYVRRQLLCTSALRNRHSVRAWRRDRDATPDGKDFFPPGGDPGMPRFSHSLRPDHENARSSGQQNSLTKVRLRQAEGSLYQYVSKMHRQLLARGPLRRSHFL